MTLSTANLPALGQAYGGGFVTGITCDIETGVRRLHITAGAEHELTGPWGNYGTKIAGAESFTDSLANTQAMAAVGSDIAEKVLALAIGGFNDWAIPARDVQELQYRHFKPTTEYNWEQGRSGENPSSEPVGRLYREGDPVQASHEAFRDGGVEAFQESVYWSSTQRSAYDAFGIYMGAGDQSNHVKSSPLRVRPVRSEIIS